MTNNREKLVRDNMPDICNSGGKHVTPMTYRIATEKEMPVLLVEKLLEEVGELKRAILSGGEWHIIEEFGDVKEVLAALEAHLDYGHHIEEKRIQKLKERGAFWRGVVWDGKK